VLGAPGRSEEGGGRVMKDDLECPYGARSVDSGRRKAVAVLQGDVLPAEAVRGAQSEADFQKTVLEFLRLRGWETLVLPRYVLYCAQRHPVHWGRRVKRGWPDILALRPPRRLTIECKAESGEVDPDQVAFRMLLDGCGFETVVLRPSGLDDFMVLVD
jgi:hypothetical protein